MVRAEGFLVHIAMVTFHAFRHVVFWLSGSALKQILLSDVGNLTVDPQSEMKSLYGETEKREMARSDDLLPLKKWSGETAPPTELRSSDESFMQPNRCYCAQRWFELWIFSKIWSSQICIRITSPCKNTGFGGPRKNEP